MALAPVCDDDNEPGSRVAKKKYNEINFDDINLQFNIFATKRASGSREKWRWNFEIFANFFSTSIIVSKQQQAEVCGSHHDDAKPSLSRRVYIF